MIETIPTVELSKYIEVGASGDLPHLRSNRLPIICIANSASTQPMTVTQLAYQYSITEVEVLAALLYYRDHKAEIDALIAEDSIYSQKQWFCGE